MMEPDAHRCGVPDGSVKIMWEPVRVDLRLAQANPQVNDNHPLAVLPKVSLYDAFRFAGRNYDVVYQLTTLRRNALRNHAVGVLQPVQL